MSMDYDFLIIGGGAAGKDVALLAAGAGLETLLIEKEKLGGTLITKVVERSRYAEWWQAISRLWPCSPASPRSWAWAPPLGDQPIRALWPST